MPPSSTQPLPSPRIVAVCDQPTQWQNLPPLGKETAHPCDHLELRLDALLPSPSHHLEFAHQIPTAQLPPVILTARHPSEGSKSPWSEAELLTALHHHLHLASWVDLELSQLRAHAAYRDTAQAIHAHGPSLLCSMHDFQGTPTASALLEHYQHAQELGANAFKIATTLTRPQDLQPLLTLLEHSQTDCPISAMGMGPLGKASRLYLALAGSHLNYCTLGQALIQGQWTCQEFHQLLHTS